jgi:hypothetical protein
MERPEGATTAECCAATKYRGIHDQCVPTIVKTSGKTLRVEGTEGTPECRYFLV